MRINKIKTTLNQMILPSMAMLLLASVVSCAPAGQSPAVSPVVMAYREWCLAQADEYLVAVEAFVSAFRDGKRELAKSLYAPSRTYYERIEPIAEALGDLDKRIDAREGNVAAADWRGFHRLEQILWTGGDLAMGKALSDQLLADSRLLRALLESATISTQSLVTGAVELLNEVSSSKVTGEEERYSHTDLWDFQANVEGSAKIWELFKTSVSPADPELSRTIDEKFSALLSLLASHRQGNGFKLYGELKPTEVKALAAAVDALAEPLAQIGKYLIKA